MPPCACTLTLNSRPWPVGRIALGLVTRNSAIERQRSVTSSNMLTLVRHGGSFSWPDAVRKRRSTARKPSRVLAQLSGAIFLPLISNLRRRVWGARTGVVRLMSAVAKPKSETGDRAPSEPTLHCLEAGLLTASTRS